MDPETTYYFDFECRQSELPKFIQRLVDNDATLFAVVPARHCMVQDYWQVLYQHTEEIGMEVKT